MHATRTPTKPSCRCIRTKLISNAHKNTSKIWLQMHTKRVETKLGCKCMQMEQQQHLVVNAHKRIGNKIWL